MRLKASIWPFDGPIWFPLCHSVIMMRQFQYYRKRMLAGNEGLIMSRRLLLSLSPPDSNPIRLERPGGKKLAGRREEDVKQGTLPRLHLHRLLRPISRSPDRREVNNSGAKKIITAPEMKVTARKPRVDPAKSISPAHSPWRRP